jgi:3-hydroxyacyl-[acyl-carrier-protein] dehydratase
VRRAPGGTVAAAAGRVRRAPRAGRRPGPASAEGRAEVSELDIGMIRRLLPHRYPMLLVDRVLEWEAGKFLRGVKNVTINEPFFQGHFPAYPVMPGVLVIEAMAQVAGLLTMLSDVARRDGSQLVLFAGIDDARFKRQVLPGDTLLLEARLERAVRGIGRFHTKATVDGQLVCEAQLLAAIRDVPPQPDIPLA